MRTYATFVRLHNEGLYPAEIGRQTGFTGAFVAASLRISGILPHNGHQPTDVVRNEKMVGMFRQGLTLEKIGQTFGVTRERVRQVLKKAGVTGVDGGQHKQASSKKQARANLRMASNLAKWGMTPAQIAVLRDNGATRSFASQRNAASQRGIQWSLSLAQWWDLWQTSGKWAQRGRGKGKYVMSRIKDTGGYEVGNVHIQLAEENSLEAVDKADECAEPEKVRPELTWNTQARIDRFPADWKYDKSTTTPDHAYSHLLTRVADAGAQVAPANGSAWLVVR